MPKTKEPEIRDANEVLHEVVEILADCIGELRVLTQLLEYPDFGDRIMADKSGNTEYEFCTISGMIKKVDEAVEKAHITAISNI